MINQVPFRSEIHRNGIVTTAWRQWFESALTILFSLQQSGTTAQRPTKKLWVGRRYFDTTLGHPIWYDGTNWVDATGATV